MKPLPRASAVGAPARTLRTTLRRLRRRQGLSTFEMAEALDLDVRTYERMAAGRTRLDLPRVFALAEILDVDPLGLVGALRFDDPAIAEATTASKLLSALALTLARLDPGQRQALEQRTGLELLEGCEALLRDLVGVAPPLPPNRRN